MKVAMANACRVFLGFILLSALRTAAQSQTPQPTTANLTASTGYVCIQRNADSRI
jgi:hypothetical protein